MNIDGWIRKTIVLTVLTIFIRLGIVPSIIGTIEKTNGKSNLRSSDDIQRFINFSYSTF